MAPNVHCVELGFHGTSSLNQNPCLFFPCLPKRKEKKEERRKGKKKREKRKEKSYGSAFSPAPGKTLMYYRTPSKWQIETPSSHHYVQDSCMESAAQEAKSFYLSSV